MKNSILTISFLYISALINAQNPGDIYLNYDELLGIKFIENSMLEVHYNIKGKSENQKTDFVRSANGIKLGKLSYNANPNVKKLSSESLEFKNGNLYLPKYKMFFYSDENRKTMEKRDCYVVNNEIFYVSAGKVKGKLKKAIKNLRKESLQTAHIDSKTTYDKYGIHCLGATEILGMPKK